MSTINLKKLKNKTSHVGLVYKNKSEILIIHSCRENKGAGIQELKEVLKKYRVVEARRMVGKKNKRLWFL